MNSPLPYKNSSVDEIVIFHTIEHIRKVSHQVILLDCWRVLKPGGELYISYPEFTKCYENWKSNYRGKREFWEATMFGRQLYPSDYHVCAMETAEFERLLIQCGFKHVFSCPESGESYNTVVNCIKGAKVKSYEDVIKDDMKKTVFERVKL